MSGATGAAAGGTGPDRRQAAVQADTGGAPGSPTDSGPQQGGSTVTDTRPPHHAGRPQTYGAAVPGTPDQPPHQPAQAYPPPPSAPASAGAPAAAGVRRPRPAARTVPRTRKARLRVARADPWSVMKVSFLLSIALGICTIVAVAVLWMVLDAIGVFSTVGSTISDATTAESGGSGGFDLVSFLSLSRVLVITTVIAVIDVVLATALATLGAFIYNMSAGFVGGVELTLAEDE
ncbi:DUF3566 domain-containing protein [Streptomyces sp. H10-C2]|uniref:DUF3566 domain-containing protein n=1 Tax=unclassified Streptomyces TaxID=2593676 RepID=UPI0024BAA68D|nr:MULTISPECIES: DUF3566 domain-containing protein [unclassified Streptomyces]MDJ0340230.1 DUF3566 domain-containing protein [Streptomyces sp. PH10-H1]MDJ0368321.1 DUF3566 domain-containing protein [Streptomyces sp. H10-C2]